MNVRIGLLVLVCASIPCVAVGEEAKRDLVVHEWGVFVRQNTFPETLGPPKELVGDLPRFVGLHSGYKPEQMMRSWRKPVLHFYGKEQKVKVQILTPTGRPVAYWPKPALIEEVFWKMGTGVKDAVGLEWECQLKSAKPEGVKEARVDHWWNEMREVDSLWVETAGGTERFLFYEGTGRSQPAIAATINGGELVLKNLESSASGMVLVIVNNGEELYLEKLESIPGDGGKSIRREKMLAAPVNEEQILEASRQQWESFGMTEEEAAMITSVWKNDLCRTGGFLVVSRMPPKIYDEYIFPIKIEPQPDELVRAAVVFDSLPGVPGRIGWLPDIEDRISEHLKKLGSADPGERETATTEIGAFGDLAIDVLASAIRSDDLETRMRVKSLLGSLAPRTAYPLPNHLGKGSQVGVISHESRLGPKADLVGVLERDENGALWLVVPNRGKVMLRNYSDGGIEIGSRVQVSGYFLTDLGVYGQQEQGHWLFEVAESRKL